MDEFEARAGAYISQHQMLQKGDTVIVALSGGADSMALFHFLFSAQNALGLRLRAAHVNHGLRGDAADADAAFVRAQCAARGVPLDETRLSPPESAGEEWGRRERYAFFARLARERGAKVATAHTCSDNAETVLFNLARGSAARGAAGIPPVRGLYVRPLLWAQREDILAYLARCGVPYVTDATNDTDAYARNRIRHGALPALESAHPGAVRSIARFAAEMSAVADYLDEQAEALLERARVPREAYLPGNLPDAYRARMLAEAPVAVRRTALARLIAAAAPQQKTCLVPAVDALLANGDGAVQLCEGAYVSVRQGLLTVGPKQTEPDSDAECWHQPFVPGIFAAPGGLLLEIRLVNYEKMVNSEKDVRNLLKFYADYGKIQDNPCFRTRRSGDTFRPAGRGVTKTLKKLLSEHKVPPAARAALPVLAAGGTVLWAAGFGFAEGLAPDEFTKTAVTVTARQMEESICMTT